VHVVGLYTRTVRISIHRSLLTLATTAYEMTQHNKGMHIVHAILLVDVDVSTVIKYVSSLRAEILYAVFH